MSKFAIGTLVGITGLIISAGVFDHLLLGVGIGFGGILVGLICDDEMRRETPHIPKQKKPKTKEELDHEAWLAYTTFSKKRRG